MESESNTGNSLGLGVAFISLVQGYTATIRTAGFLSCFNSICNGLNKKRSFRWLKDFPLHSKPLLIPWYSNEFKK